LGDPALKLKYGVFPGVLEKGIEAVNLMLICVPNPFRQATHIAYSLGLGAKGETGPGIELKIYDASGGFVKQFNFCHDGAFNQVTWHGDDNVGKKLPSGIYFVKLEVGKLRILKKVVLLR